jgi:predicted ATPase
VLAEELGVEPSANTRDLYEQIRAGGLRAEDESPSSTPTAPIHNLPVSLTLFHGREQELLDLERLIADLECRCISLVGPGGIGKTRLALQAAQQHRADFSHGVAFVPLASVGSVEAAIPAIAGAIRLHFYGPNDPRTQLLNHLSEKQMLLILDNVEQLLIEGPPQANIVELLPEILQRAPRVKLLVTSREVLNLQEEWVFEVGGLAFPEAGQTAKPDEHAAVALFMERARHASPGFAFREADLAAIAHISRLVEGMPLAIELAATWSRMLSPVEIAKEIEGSLDILSASVRDLPERHRSMRVVFDQTWRTLSAEEQRVLSQLSVFRGGFSRQAAEQVAGASLPILSTLVNRMLIRRAAAGRYDLHELVRQYSATHLAADPQAQAAAQERHYRHFLALAEAAEQELRGRNQLEWLGRLEQEQDNLRAALAWALESDRATLDGEELAMRLSGALRRFWRTRGHFHEGCSWLTKSLQKGPEGRTAARAAALLAQGSLLYGEGDVGAARQPAEESLAIYRELGDERGQADALSFIGYLLIWQGEASLGRARLEEALAISLKAGDRWGEADSLVCLGYFLADRAGDPAGRAMLEQGAAILEDLGGEDTLCVVLVALGVVAVELGDYTSARAHLEHALAIAREIEHQLGLADALINLGCVYRILGEYSTAQSYLEQSRQVYQAHGCGAWETDVVCALAENAISQGHLSAARSYLQAASDLLGTSENKWLQALVCYFRGLLAHYEGDALSAMTLLDKAMVLAREGQFKPDLARSLVTLGRVKHTLGQVLPASELLLEGLDLFRALGHKLGIANALEELGAVSAVQGDGVQAAMLLGAAHALREGLGAPLPPVDRAAHDSVVAACRSQLGETAFAEAWAHAAARSWQEVVEDALNVRHS